MKLSDESTATLNVVRSYTPGELRIGADLYRRSCLIAAERIVSDWPPQTMAELSPEHLDAVLAMGPEVIILGTGPQQSFPDTALVSLALTRGIGMEVMDTGAACRTFNILVAEGRRAVAALLL